MKIQGATTIGLLLVLLGVETMDPAGHWATAARGWVGINCRGPKNRTEAGYGSPANPSSTETGAWASHPRPLFPLMRTGSVSWDTRYR